MATVACINIGNGGVPKWSVERAEVTCKGLIGDRQAKPGIHGGIYRAVSLFSLDVIETLIAEGHPIAPGSTGENITVMGMDWNDVVPGIVMQLGADVRLKITSYALPCATTAGSFLNGDSTRIHHRKHPGFSRVYAQVLREGRIANGDPILLSP